MTSTESLMEPRSSSMGVTEGWDLDGIPRRFWPRVRELLEMRDAVRYSAPATAVAGALLNAITIESIARKAGPAGEGLARAAASLVAEWDGDLCPPYRTWPPRKKHQIAEEIIDILSQVIDVVPEGAIANGIRSLGSSMEQKLNRSVNRAG